MTARPAEIIEDALRAVERAYELGWGDGPPAMPIETLNPTGSDEPMRSRLAPRVDLRGKRAGLLANG